MADARIDHFRSAPAAIKRLRELRDRTALFSPNASEEEQRRSFLLWWDSWVAPCIDTLERRVCPKKPKAPNAQA